MVLQDMITVPNVLTLMRLVCSPLVLPLFFVYLLPFNSLFLNSLLLILYLIFGGTDFLDGYLARKYGQVSSLGSILDPIADKFLLYSTLIALLAAGKIFFYWVILLIGREFFVMGIRLLAAEHTITIPVSFWAKVKTVLQSCLIGYLIINPYQQLDFSQAPWWHAGEWILMIATLGISFITAHWYYQELTADLSYRSEWQQDSDTKELHSS